MRHAAFFAPISVSRDDLLRAIASALRDFDLPPPTRVVLSREALARSLGVWAFVLGSPREEGREVHRGFFMDFLRDSWPVGFLGHDSAGGPEEVFELRAYDRASSLLLTSRGPLLAGAVDCITVQPPQQGMTNAELARGVGPAAQARANGWGAITIGLRQTGLQVTRALESGDVLALSGTALVPTGGDVLPLIFPGIDPNDPYPRETDETRIGVPRAPAPPAPKRELSLDQMMELENEAGAILRSNGDLSRAKQILERVLASFPKSTRGQALYTDVLRRLGDPGIERTLVQRFESGLASPGFGEAMILNVVHPTRDLVEHLARSGRRGEAHAVIERAARVLTPHFAPMLDPVRRSVG